LSNTFLYNLVKIPISSSKQKAMGTFIIKQRSNSEFQFNLQAGNGKNILSSEGYTSRAGCDGGIESVRKNAPQDARYDRLNSSNGKFYFNLKATNGQVIGTSEMYETAYSRDEGIEAVMRIAPDASVSDQTA
jgi:uncharacterized protein YegP (UPF0339 family)